VSLANKVQGTDLHSLKNFLVIILQAFLLALFILSLAKDSQRVMFQLTEIVMLPAYL
jgi:hypothetical protein